MITLSNLGKFFGEQTLFEGVSLQFNPGERYGIVGANGCGKSTLLKILTGTTFPTSGNYKIHGRVASLLELGAGFNQNFSGRENIFVHPKYIELLTGEENVWVYYAGVETDSEAAEYV